MDSEIASSHILSSPNAIATDKIINAVPSNFGVFLRSSSPIAQQSYFKRAQVNLEVEKQEPKRDGYCYQHSDAENIKFSYKSAGNPYRQETNCTLKPILPKDENLSYPFGYQKCPISGTSRKVKGNQQCVFHNKELKSRNFDTVSTELIYKCQTSNFGCHKCSKASYCAGDSFQSFKEFEHLATEHLDMEVEITESIHAMEQSDYIDYISSKLEETCGEKEILLEGIGEKISCTSIEKQTQQTKGKTNISLESSIQNTSLTTVSTFQTKKIELEYSSSQIHLLSMAPIQISPVSLICSKENHGLLYPNENLLSYKNSDLLNKFKKTTKPTMQKDQHSNPDQVVKTKEVVLEELQSPKSMQLLSNFNSSASQSELSTQTKPLETPKWICLKSARGFDLADTFSCTEDFILGHQKQRQLNKMALFTQIGNMVYALTDFVTEKLSISSISAQVRFICI